MTEQDYRQVYQELAMVLCDLHLNWVVEQVERWVGTIDKADVSETLNYSAQSRTASRQAVLVKPRTHQAQESLLLLMGLAEKAVADRIDLEGALLDFTASQEDHLQMPVTLGFASDDDEGIVQLGNDLTERRQAVMDLRQLLQQLRQEVLAGVD